MDDHIKAHDDLVLQNERERVRRKLEQVRQLLDSIDPDSAEVKPSRSNPIKEKAPALDKASIDDKVLGALPMSGEGLLSCWTIATYARLDPKAVSQSLARLFRAGKAHFEGQRRAKKWGRLQDADPAPASPDQAAHE